MKPRISRETYLQRAELVRAACQLAGISRATFDRRPKETRETMIAAAQERRREAQDVREAYLRWRAGEPPRSAARPSTPAYLLLDDVGGGP